MKTFAVYATRFLALSMIPILVGCQVTGPGRFEYRTNAPDYQVSPASVQDITEVVVPTAQDLSTTRQDIETLVDLGRSRNPQLIAAAHRVAAAESRVCSAGALPDPIVSTATHLAPIESAAGRQQFALGLSQKFVAVEKRSVRTAIAHEEVERRQADFEKLSLNVGSQIRTAAVRLLWMDRSLEILRSEQKLLQRLERVIQNEYEVRKEVSRQDWLNVQVEISKLENEVLIWKQKRKSALARLNRLLHLPPSNEIVVDRRLNLDPSTIEFEALLDQAVHSRPELRSLLAEVRKLRNQSRLANLDQKPDVSVGLNWIATSSAGISPVANGDDALILGFAFNLPIDSARIGSQVAAAESESFAAVESLTALRSEIEEEIVDLVFRLESNQATLELVRDDILPKTRLTLDLTISEYQNGGITFVQLVENWRQVMQQELSEARLVWEQQQILIDLARSIGESSIGESSIGESSIAVGHD